MVSDVVLSTSTSTKTNSVHRVSAMFVDQDIWPHLNAVVFIRSFTCCVYWTRTFLPYSTWLFYMLTSNSEICCLY